MRRRLAVCALLAALAPLLAACGSSGTQITARFPDAAGLFVGNDVGVLGVKVGEVESITPRGDHVDVVLRVDGDVKIPADAGAVIASRSVATDRYVEITPVYTSGPVMASGAVIGTDRTRNPVEFDQLMASLKTIADDLSGEDGAQPINEFLTITAKTVEGKGEQVADLLRDLATTLEAASASSDDFATTLRNLDALTSALAENDDVVRQFSVHVTQATDLLNDEKDSVGATLDALTALLARVSAFVRAHRDELGSQVKDLGVVVDALVGDEGNLTELLQTFPLALQNGRAAVVDNHLTFLTRPADLIPNEAGFAALCAYFPEGACDGLEPGTATLFDLFRQLAGVSQP